jgi:uncharacterized protein (DUF1499 family)
MTSQLVEIHLVQTSPSTYSVQTIVDALNIMINHDWTTEFTLEEAEARMLKVEANYRRKGYRNFEINRRKAEQMNAQLPNG